MQKYSLKPILILLGFAASIIGALLVLDHMTLKQRNAQAQHAFKQVLNQVAPVSLTNNDTLQALEDKWPLGSPLQTIYPIYRNGYQGAIVKITVANGYNGPIDLLAGIRANHRIHKIHILQHHETPGLGDQIEANKSNWLTQFSNETILQPASIQHRLTGATVTERAILTGLNQTLDTLRPILKQLAANKT